MTDAERDADAFMALLPAHLPRPNRRAVAEDGGVVLDWRAGDRRMVVMLDGDGQFGWAVYRDGRYFPGDVDGDLASGRLPQDLIAYLAPSPGASAMTPDVVGRRFRACDGHVYVCDGYDPSCGFWMTREDAPPERRRDQEGEWRRAVSELAIGRTYHRLHEPRTPTESTS